MNYVEILSMGKDIGVMTGIAALLWKVFAFLQAATKTAKAIPTFMENTQLGIDDLRVHAKQAVTNHLTHIEDGITSMASDTKVFAVSMETLRTDFHQHAIKDAETQAIILERLPEL